MTPRPRRRSSRRGGAPPGYKPKDVRPWPAGPPEPYLPVSAGSIPPIATMIMWAAQLTGIAVLHYPVPVWIAVLTTAAGLAQSGWWLTSTKVGNQWFNAYLYATSLSARRLIPPRALPPYVREHPPPGVMSG